ncbi:MULTISPECIES: type 2 periplasmic-binding domain-containing protein [unclassified Isoptericola]|uniref:hypothetical protein n=1 Tax=unclassified Isoptericola TaxID=2623355 RepID=UPI003665521E
MSASPRLRAADVSRRGFLGGLALATVGGPLLTACGSSGGASTAAGPRAVLPTQVPFSGPVPDLAGDLAKAINPGYFRYPVDQLVRSVTDEVGSGGEMSAFVVTFSAPPPQAAKNAYWQAINDALGVDFKPTLVPTDFATKLAAVMTGGDIPDLVTMYLRDAAGLRRFDDLAKARFADLTDHLSGDAIKDYPNLARLPREAWPATLVDGRIYATPTLRIPTGYTVFYQPEVFEKYGANPAPRTPDEVREMCATFTDARANRYAMADGTWMTGPLMYPMFDVPNNWSIDGDGNLTKDWESDGFLDCVDYIKGLWDKGYIHPDAPSEGFDAEPLFENGSVAVRSDNMVRYTVRNDSGLNPAIMSAYSSDGTPTTLQASVTDFVTFVKKGDDARVQECLRVLNWLSAPFGSEENFLRTYGVEGVDHRLDAGLPTLTSQGEAEVYSLSLRFIAGGPDVLYSTIGDTGMVETMHTYQGDVSPGRVEDPTSGLRSDADVGATNLKQKVTDTMTDVIVGRKPMADLESAIDTWRTEAGDKVRAEYEEAIAARDRLA